MLPAGLSQLPWQAPADAELVQLLQYELTADNAVKLALWNNPALRAQLAAIGVAEADFSQLSRPADPGLSIKRSRSESGYQTELEFSFDLLGLIFLPKQRQLASSDLYQQQLQLAQSIVQLKGNTQRSYYQAVAASQSYQYQLQVIKAAEAGAELAGRLKAIGNLSQLDLARQQSYLADAKLQLALAEQQQFASRQQLLLQLGLMGQSFRVAQQQLDSQQLLKLPKRLPALPQQLPVQALPALEAEALAKRLDLQLAAQQLQQVQLQLGLAQQNPTGDEVELTAGGSVQQADERSLELALKLPIFDGGQSQRDKARAQLLQQQALLQAHRQQALYELRQSWFSYQSQYQIARHYQLHILGLTEQIQQENQLRYNGMLLDVFSLLQEARSQVQAVTATISAQRDFYLAEVALQQAMLGAAPAALPMGGAAVATNNPAQSAAAH
jgi:outer membrane protein TolC